MFANNDKKIFFFKKECFDVTFHGIRLLSRRHLSREIWQHCLASDSLTGNLPLARTRAPERGLSAPNPGPTSRERSEAETP